jgi:hypothetical protein
VAWAWCVPGRSLGTASHAMRSRTHALTRSGSAAAQALRVVRLVPVWSVSGLPAGVDTAPHRWRVGSHGHARGGLTRWGRWLASWWGRSPAHALPGWGKHQGNRSGCLRQPVRLRGTVGARVQRVQRVGRGGRGGARPLAGHCLAHDAPACSGSAAAQALRVVWLVPVRSVARCPLAWPQRPAAGAVDRTGTPGVGSPGGAGGWRGGAVAAQLTPGPGWGAPGKTHRAGSGKGRGLPGCGVSVRSGGAGGSVKGEGIAPAKPAHRGRAGGWAAGQGKAKGKKGCLYE